MGRFFHPQRAGAKNYFFSALLEAILRFRLTVYGRAEFKKSASSALFPSAPLFTVGNYFDNGKF